jgi:AcrR family transcriptional regulator
MVETSTRSRILAVAGELFYSEGIRSVGVEMICKQAGIKKPTLYHHFGSKDGLIAAYLEDRDEKVLAGLTRAAEQADGSVADKVAAIFERVAKAAPRASWKGCPFLRGAAEFAGNRNHPARKLASAHKHRFERWLADFLADHGVSDPLPLARQLTVLLDGAVSHVFLHGDQDYALEAGKAARSLIQAHRR